MKSDRSTLYGAILALLLLVVVLMAGSGCGTPATIARKTITAIDVANASAPRLARVVVRQCIDRAVALGKAGDRNAGEQALQDCASQRDRILAAVKISVDATDLAASGVDLAEAGQAKDFSALLAPAYQAARALMRLLADAGVKVPTIPGVYP